MGRSRRALLAVVAALLGGPLGAVACTSFDATAPDTSSDGGGLFDGSPPDASAEISDAAPDGAQLGDGALLPVPVAQESAQTAYVATDAQFIYWWSTSLKSIRRADKDHPATVITVMNRPQATAVTALAVDSSGIYWIEVGPDMVQDGSRIMQLTLPLSGTPTPTVLYRTADPLSGLAVDPSRALSTYANGIVGATKSGSPIKVGLGIDGRSITSDGIDVFYSFSSNYIFRLTATNASFQVIALPAPRELTVEGSVLYGVMDSDGGSAIFKTDKGESNASIAAATPLAQAAGSTIFLAIDNLGLVWGNASDGSIHRVDRLGSVQSGVASGLAGLNAVAADARGVYWTTDTGAVGWAPR